VGVEDILKELRDCYGETFDEIAAQRDKVTIFKSKGCRACGESGYKGRLGLHELLVNNEEIRAAVQSNAAATKVRDLSIAGGMTTLLQDGIIKCLDGITDLKQVLAVCSR